MDVTPSFLPDKLWDFGCDIMFLNRISLLTFKHTMEHTHLLTYLSFTCSFLHAM